jgi:hypothetical protein
VQTARLKEVSGIRYQVSGFRGGPGRRYEVRNSL